MKDVWQSLNGMPYVFKGDTNVKSPCSAKAREKQLERELTKLLGENWQVREPK